MTLQDVIALEQLEDKLRVILPSLYRDSYEDVKPISMGSAGLKYDAEGQVAWNEIWATFCDLAMAGGPPHRGTLLQPALGAEIAANKREHEQVLAEIRRGLALVTGLPVDLSDKPGWIAVRCQSAGMAAWLVRAIVMENVLARHEKETLYLPVGPAFRVEKEVKNVITAIAKTCHYWTAHMPPEQRQALETLFTTAGARLLEPALTTEIEDEPGAYRDSLERITHALAELGLTCFPNRYAGWIGVEFPGTQSAVWIMRAIIVDNILVRREGQQVFVPVTFDRNGDCSERVVNAVARAYHLSRIRKDLTRR